MLMLVVTLYASPTSIQSVKSLVLQQESWKRAATMIAWEEWRQSEHEWTRTFPVLWSPLLGDSLVASTDSDFHYES